MKKHISLKIYLYLYLIIAFSSCGKDDSEEYSIIPTPSPVVLDLEAVPYPKLSDYNFFDGEIKNLNPVKGVVPYDLNSTLFTDYALKKRFVWMPENVKASYVSDDDILNFPDGAVLIKNFYYNNIQPDNSTRIIETRLMIKKGGKWIFANYVWNNEQTEALYNMNGGFTNITWLQDSEIKTTNYRIPSKLECYTCHKSQQDSVPIGPKPQNLNKLFDYSDGTKNQLNKWIEHGYLENNLPQNITASIDWTDETQPLELRVRSYLDINCAHCHREGSHCDYRPIRLAFSETITPSNLGICVEPQEFINNSLKHIISQGSTEKSEMYYRLNSVMENERMPLLGRTIQHTEALELMEEWINSMEEPCP
ncbi:hypothetical protein GN157_06030 [Flavobacterium rakeshii]|uniref:Repeat protein (TIGR03806 family) n=1 Tax=Flavobacterium rakeshii TaxID=1038845 RepID=A0A6N8HBE4_9FLAO|nr:hypothetical protein [Flavobacterium rakeshii]MUV03263.1 hypothetical protein [Flavobacterium rakeshii]